MADRTPAFDELVRVVARLRAPGGCPWDQAQTPESLKPYLLEEAFEVLEAIEEGNPTHLREELGDLLLHIVFQAQIAREHGSFDIQKVAEGIRDKMIQRHPHVFASDHAPGAQQVIEDWERTKRDNRGKKNGQASILDGIPKTLPALLAAARMSDRAARAGFDWPDIAGVWAKLDEELEELHQAMDTGDKVAMRHELGDVLFTMVNLARFLEIDPEDALRGANSRFSTRFRRIEQVLANRGQKPEDVDMVELERLWVRAKSEEDRGTRT